VGGGCGSGEVSEIDLRQGRREIDGLNGNSNSR
jgi:hypothetical protein